MAKDLPPTEQLLRVVQNMKMSPKSLTKTKELVNELMTKGAIPDERVQLRGMSEAESPLAIVEDKLMAFGEKVGDRNIKDVPLSLARMDDLLCDIFQAMGGDKKMAERAKRMVGPETRETPERNPQGWSTAGAKEKYYRALPKVSDGGMTRGGRTPSGSDDDRTR